MTTITTLYRIHMLKKGVWIFSATMDYTEKLVSELQSDEHQIGWFCVACNEQQNKSCYCSTLDNFVRTTGDE